MSGQVLNPLLAFGAGTLTILSPCVLPLVPVVLGAAAQRHRFGAIALASGLVATFTAVGFVLAVFGSRLGVDSEQVRLVGALILGGAGIFLIVPKLQDWIATAAAPLVGWAGERQQRFDERGLWAQGAIGALLGLVWSPCVGPTLGAAVALGAQGRDLSQVALTMAAFALGIAAVLVAIAAAGRTLFSRVRGRIASKAKVAKLGLGIILVLVSLLVLTGLDRVIEAAFVLAAPDWLINLSTAI